MSDEKVHRELGEIRGLLSGIGDNMRHMRGKVDAIDARLSSVERKAAANGAVSGGVLGLAAALAAAVVRSKIGNL